MNSLPDDSVIRFDSAQVEAIMARHEADRAFMERARERAVAKRTRRLERLRKRAAAIRTARDALQVLSEAGDHPAIRLRREFVRLKDPRPERDANPALDPQRAAANPGDLARARRSERRTRPPMTRLAGHAGWTVPLHLSAIFEATCAGGAGRAPQDRERHLVTGRPGPWTDPWSTLLGDPDRQRNRRVRLTRALAELDRQGLVALGPRRAHDRYGAFRLLSDDDEKVGYTVPGDSVAAMSVPPQFFLQGWHLVLEPREIAVWLMLRDLKWRLGRRTDWIGVPNRVRRGYYGVTDEIYEAHYELTEFGLIEPSRDPGRKRGKLIRRAQVQREAANEASEDRPQLEAYRFAILPESVLDRDPLRVVGLALTNSPPRFD